MSLNAIKTTDVPIMKNLKATPSCVKLAFGAMCVIIGVAPEKVPEAQAKKNVCKKGPHIVLFYGTKNNPHYAKPHCSGTIPTTNISTVVERKIYIPKQGLQ